MHWPQNLQPLPLSIAARTKSLDVTKCQTTESHWIRRYGNGIYILKLQHQKYRSYCSITSSLKHHQEEKIMRKKLTAMTAMAISATCAITLSSPAWADQTTEASRSEKAATTKNSQEDESQGFAECASFPNHKAVESEIGKDLGHGISEEVSNETLTKINAGLSEANKKTFAKRYQGAKISGKWRYPSTQSTRKRTWKSWEAKSNSTWKSSWRKWNCTPRGEAYCQRMPRNRHYCRNEFRNICAMDRHPAKCSSLRDPPNWNRCCDCMCWWHYLGIHVIHN